jgi:hypothetical protein
MENGNKNDKNPNLGKISNTTPRPTTPLLGSCNHTIIIDENTRTYGVCGSVGQRC